MKKMSAKNMVNVAFAILVFGGLVVFATQNESFGRALNILRPEVKVSISGSLQRDGQNLPLAKLETVKSGEILNWNINSANSGNASAQNYRVVGQIPPGTELVKGSPTSDSNAEVKYSIDGGKTFTTVPQVDETQPDGSVKKVPAPVASYTQVQFGWAKELAADTQANAAYRVRVK